LEIKGFQGGMMRAIIGEIKKFSLLFLLAGLCFFPGSLSQSGSASQEAVRLQKPLQHEVTVTVKLIQVYVTDKNGKPVIDLTKNDFILYDDGKPQKLTEFEKHVLSLPAPAARAEEHVVQTPVPPSPRLLNRKFFLFFDFAYNNPPGVRKMGEVARHFLETQVLPTDEVGVLSFSLFKLLQINLNLTTDHRKVRDLVSKIGLRDSNQLLEDSEDAYRRKLAAGNIADARPEAKTTLPTPEMPELDMKEVWRRSAMTYVDCLTALAWALRSIQGQKNLILFSEGIPYPVAYPLFPDPLTWKYENMLKEMQTSNVAICSLYTGGITLGDSQTGAWTLSKTSDDTGGQYWGNMYNYEPFAEKVNTMTGSFYVLGYPVSEKWDGKFHAIKVEVKRPGCDVRAQNGYSNPKLFADYTDLEKRITLVDLALAEKPLSQTPMRFDMAALPRSTEPANNLLLAAAIPAGKLGDTLGKKVEVVSLAFNQTDEIVEMKRTEENFAGIRQKGAYLLSILSVPPGQYKCRIVLRDLETGQAAVAGVPVTIPGPIATGIQLFPPLLVKPDRGALYFKAHGPSAETGKKTVSADLKSLLAYDTAQYAPHLERTLYRGSEAWAVIRCAVPEGSSPKLKLTAFLFDKLTRDQIPMDLTVLEERSEKAARTFFVRMGVPDVEPDDYTLLLFAEDEVSGAKSEMACDFAVEDAVNKGGLGR
jgi:VWFA-related protein